jgi:hypothetical protein
MQIETPPSEKPYEKPEGERRGIVIVNTGDGKGKSTAAFGLALRAHGRGKAVKIYQFMKVPSARFGEHRMFEQIGIPIEGLGGRLQLEEPGPRTFRPARARRLGKRPRRRSFRASSSSSCSTRSPIRSSTAGCRSKACSKRCAHGPSMCTWRSPAAAAHPRSSSWPTP